MTKQKAKVCHYTEVEAEVFGDEAPGVTIRWVIDEEKHGAPIYALRVIEVASGGHTPGGADLAPDHRTGSGPFAPHHSAGGWGSGYQPDRCPFCFGDPAPNPRQHLAQFLT